MGLRIRAPCRRAGFKLWCLATRSDPRCPITLEPVKHPSYMRCCGQHFERQALARWAQKSRYFRRRSIFEFERVAPCPHCRGILDPAEVRDLLWQYKLPAPQDGGDFCFESDIPDPAYPHGAVHPSFVIRKSAHDLESERLSFHHAEEVRVRLTSPPTSESEEQDPQSDSLSAPQEEYDNKQVETMTMTTMMTMTTTSSDPQDGSLSAPEEEYDNKQVEMGGLGRVR